MKTVVVDRADTRVGAWVGVGAVVLVAVAGIMPGFTMGALAVPIRTDLNLGGSAFGLALAVFFAVSALASFITRRIAGRLPVPMLLVMISLLSTAALLLVSQASSAPVLGLLMVVAGFANALAQPTAGKFIAAEIPAERLSFATGLVGAALGAAPLVPGLLVSFVAAPYGWRTAFVVGAVVAVCTLALAPLARIRHRPAVSVEDELEAEEAELEQAAKEGKTPVAPQGVGTVLWLWTLAAGLGTVGVNVAATYFVQIGTSSGLRTETAGILLSGAAAVAVVVRILIGAFADRAPRHNPAMVAAMMLSGAVGLGVMTFSTPTAFITGAVLAVAGGWGWTGLLLAATMRLVPDEAPRAGAAMQIGLFSGAAVAPFAFGALVSLFGVPATVGIAALASLAGAGTILAGVGILRRA